MPGPGSTGRALYEEMVSLIYERGYHASSLRMLGRRVGIQMPSIYHYFPSKQQILQRIMVRTMEELTNAVESAVERTDGDVVSQLEAAIAAHISFHTVRRQEAYIVDSELRSLDPSGRRLITAMRDRYEQRFFELLGRGCRERRFEVDDVSLGVKALMAMCTEVATWYRPDGRLSLEQITHAYTRLFLFGVSATRALEQGPPD